jgi:hypothetical protein
MEWRELVAIQPDFVQWIVQRHGGLPEGPIKEDDYNRLKAEYEHGKN